MKMYNGNKMMSVDESTFPVVCIQQHIDNKVDTIIFFTFDARHDEYVLWGKRVNLKKDVFFEPFMFRFGSFNDMYDFIDVCLLGDSNCMQFTLILYNYNNFPMDFDVSYDFLYDNMDRTYEITGYDIDEITKKNLRKWAHICKYSYNRIHGEIMII